MSVLWRKVQLIGVLLVLLLFGKRLLTAEGSDSNSDSGDSGSSGDSESSGSDSNDSAESGSDSSEDSRYGGSVAMRKRQDATSQDALGEIPLPEE
ncbi:MAG: hypothetical protein DYG88_13605 [Chloroflexi bacterium CFX4]|nr:hypothetical protein [Chloroflexi bacterium CFX4]MDL1923568.1 hypothetical protein [Chloroflexi bacterium CFX3]